MKKIMFIYLSLIAIPYSNAGSKGDFYYRLSSRDAEAKNANAQNSEAQNFINKLTDGAIPGEKKLLAQKDLRKIPDGVSLPETVTTLFLQGNSLQTVPKTLRAPHLKRLYLNRNKIGKFKKEDLEQLLTQFPELNYLNLTGNPLGIVNTKDLEKTAQEKFKRNIEIIAKNTEWVDLIEIDYESAEED